MQPTTYRELWEHRIFACMSKIMIMLGLCLFILWQLKGKSHDEGHKYGTEEFKKSARCFFHKNLVVSHLLKNYFKDRQTYNLSIATSQVLFKRFSINYGMIFMQIYS